MYSKLLLQKLANRQANNQLRALANHQNLIDFCSNDYLGLAYSSQLAKDSASFVTAKQVAVNGATGSRLISGNHPLYRDLETYLTQFYQAPSALVFNSGYDANLGFWSAVPQRGEVVLYDEYIHASIRDGLRLSLAKSYRFKHNDSHHLEQLLQKFASTTSVYVAIESIYSMDGDQPDLSHFVELCEKYNVYLVVDEAHSAGIIGKKGEGLTAQLDLSDRIFARLITFGKAWGSHGAAILGGDKLRSFLINFARSFIYTTALTPHTLSTILAAHQMDTALHRQQLNERISYFKSLIKQSPYSSQWIDSSSPIQSCIIAGEDNVRKVAAALQKEGFFVKAILSPTVPQGQERLRICLHANHSADQLLALHSKIEVLLA